MQGSLIVESLEIGRVLADCGKATFLARGSCMYPCIRSGDMLHIESRLIDDIKVGDIAVTRRDGRLFGHRTIAKGTDRGGHYIITRPDRSDNGNDGPTRGNDVLGVVTKIEREGKPTPTARKPLKGCAKVRISFREWWNRAVRARSIKGLERVQGTGIYQAVARLWLKALHPSTRYEVRVPLKPGQTHDLCRVFPPDQFNINASLQQEGPVMEWTLAMTLNAARTPAAQVTMVRSPDRCPQGAGWHSVNLRVRARYRGAGLDKALIGKTRDILARSGMTTGPVV